MNISIRPAKKEDIEEYTALFQRTYEDAYVDDELGLTKECFSTEVMNTEDTQKYLRGNLVLNENQKTWIAFINEKMVGAITIKKVDDGFEVNGFYVAPEEQGKGIGKRLWNKAMEFAAEDGDILVDTYVHNIKTIAMYKKWGFMLDKTRGENGYFYREWPEWPKGTRAKCLYMRLTRQ